MPTWLQGILWILLFFGWMPVYWLYDYLFNPMTGKFPGEPPPDGWDDGFRYN